MLAVWLACLISESVIYFVVLLFGNCLPSSDTYFFHWYDSF